MNHLDELIAEAELGEQAKAFLEGELGQVLLGFARQEVEEARFALEDVDASDSREIMKLQMQAKFGRCFEQWLKELVIRGEEAKGAFRDESSE